VSGRATLALFAAGARHRRELAAPVREEIARWRELARAIPDEGARALALSRLDRDSGHAVAATMLATLAPRELRPALARTILAAELLYDHLDSRTESLPAGEGLAAARRLYDVFADACAMRRVHIPEDAGDRRYLAELAGATREGLASLPGALLVRGALAQAAARAAEAQARLHAGDPQLESWAGQAAAGSGLRWREHLAGCGASVLCVHALALRGARPGGAAPQDVDRAYLQLAALATLLDGLLDGDRHGCAGRTYTGMYETDGELGEAILVVAGGARALLGALGPRHEMMLAGLIAHYCSLPGAREPRAAEILARLRRGNRAAIALASRALADRHTRPERARPALPLPSTRAGDEPARG